MSKDETLPMGSWGGSKPADTQIPTDVRLHEARTFGRGILRSGSETQGNRGGKSEIVEWAKGQNLLVNSLPWRLYGTKDVGGSEHHVFYEKGVST